MSNQVTGGWWCKLCNREYPDGGRPLKFVNGIAECPDCYHLMKRIERKLGDSWMSGA